MGTRRQHSRREESRRGHSQIIAMKVCAALMSPFSEYSAKHAVWRTQKTNIPIVDAMKSGLRPTLSHSSPAMIAMMKLKMLRMPFCWYQG